MKHDSDDTIELVDYLFAVNVTRIVLSSIALNCIDSSLNLSTSHESQQTKLERIVVLLSSRIDHLLVNLLKIDEPELRLLELRDSFQDAP